MKRKILCKDCEEWMCYPNVELGSCKFSDNEEEADNITYYNTPCIFGLFEEIDPDVTIESLIEEVEKTKF